MADEETAPLVDAKEEDKKEDNNDNIKKEDDDEKKEDNAKNDDNIKKEDDDDDEKKEEKEEEVDDDEKMELVPADYSPKPRGSLAQTAAVPAYPADARRMSKLEMDNMKDQIDNMTKALIEDPKVAARKYSTKQSIDKIEEKDDIQQNIHDATKSNKYASSASRKKFHSKKELEKLSPSAVCLGLSPLIFIIFLVIFGGIVYAVKSGAKSRKTFEAGPYGDWPNWGGNLLNQQHAANVSINTSNVGRLQKLCDYEQQYKLLDDMGMAGSSGYIATDIGSRNGFFVDESGYVTSINLEDCSLNWRVDIATAVGMEGRLRSRNGVALYRDSSGNKGVLIGTPNAGTNNEKCYVLSLNQNDGTTIFSLELTANGAPYCRTDGFIVDGNYAFGGISTINSCYYADDEESCTYKGEVIKIDLNEKKVINRWYSLPNNTDYIGAAPQNYPAIIGDYLIIGTGPLFKNPDSVDSCITDGSEVSNPSPNNPCNMDMSAYSSWRCHEDGVNTDSVNILNKTSFEYIASKSLQGNDVMSDKCNIWDIDNYDSSICKTLDVLGPGAAVSAQAAYTKGSKMYSAVLTKSGMFYVFRVPSLELEKAKKIGPAGPYGGGLYSLAIDNDNYIAIITISGLGANYKVELADGTIICRTGFVEAIDLDTGDTLWQFVNPYGIMNDDCTDNQGMYNITDWSIIRGGPSCNKGLPSVTDIVTNVVIPTDQIQDSQIPKDVYNRANFLAPVTIANDLVFIPSNTGDIFISNIMDGTLLQIESCPNMKNMTSNEYNRAGISAGITVVQDRVIIYCGSGQFTPFSSGKQVKSYRLI